MTTTKIFLPLLERIEIASPCSAKWDDMKGTDTKRFCQQCRLHVYDLSTMTESDAEELLQTKLKDGGRACVRLFRRTDGRVLTRDCPVGLSRIRLRMVKSIAGVVAFLFGGIAMAAGSTRLGKWAEQRQNASAIMGRVSSTQVGSFAMGAICVTPITPAQDQTSSP